MNSKLLEKKYEKGMILNMRVKCGTDIIEIKRIKNSIEKLGDKFIKKIFTEKEISYCENKKNQKYQHYAARFAAKEAAFKALSWKIKHSNKNYI